MSFRVYVYMRDNEFFLRMHNRRVVSYLFLSIETKTGRLCGKPCVARNSIFDFLFGRLIVARSRYHGYMG
jgi:hypothetical protein